MRRVLRALIGIAAILLPAVALAQDGQIAGTVRDTSAGVMPGVTVEATSPALIEKVRTTTTDNNGQYRLTNLPVGTYTVTFTLGGFGPAARQRRAHQRFHGAGQYSHDRRRTG